MQAIGPLFVAIAVICFMFMALVTHVSHLLFRTLKKGYAGYYKSIGEPDSIVFPKLSDTEEDFIRKYTRMMRSGWRIWRLVVKGIPEDFPEDVRVRNLARFVRFLGTVAFVSWFVAVILGYFFYQSTLTSGA